MVQSQQKPNRAKTRTWDKSKYTPKRRFCAFCADKVEVIDYKDPGKLRHYVSSRERIAPRRRTGTCAKHQRALSIAIKRARHLALLPFSPNHAFGTGEVDRVQQS
jgi:small subunit ribosomal protein S18